MTSLWRDLRHALRFLRLSPGFTFVAVLTLALGIGANTAIFQLIDSIRLRTIPVKNPQELGTIRIADRHWGSGQFSSQYSQLTFAMWEQIRKRQEGFAEIAVWSDQRFNLATGGEVRYAKGIRVSGEFFHVIGVEPILGRLVGPADDQPGCGTTAANISYAFWQRNFSGDPSAVGKKLTLDGHSFEIVGITPPGFNGVSVGDTFDVAVPICVEPILSPRNNRLTIRHAWWLASIGRLKPGCTIARASAQIKAVTPAILQETIPPFYDAEGVKKFLEYKLGAFPASTGFSQLRADSETSLWLLLGISGLVLLIACANLANLMLARAGARERQITIRLALGATRADDSRAAFGKPAALRGGGDLRPVSGVCGKPLACRAHQHSGQPDSPGSGHGLARAGIHHGPRSADDSFLRAGAGRARDAGGTCHAAAVRQPGNVGRPRTVQLAADIGCLASGAFRCAVSGRAAVCSQLAQFDDSECGFPAERNPDHQRRFQTAAIARGALFGLQTRDCEAAAGHAWRGIRCSGDAGPVWREHMESKRADRRVR